MGEKALASELAIDESTAEKFKDQFKSTYRELDLFIHRCQEDCKRDKFITTLLNRRRLFDDKATQGPRIALNSKIQGSAADILRLALIKIEEKIQQESLDAQLIMQLHDEVIYEVSSAQLSKSAQIIESCMTNCANLSVKLPVTLKAGKNWGQMENIPSTLG